MNKAIRAATLLATLIPALATANSVVTSTLTEKKEAPKAYMQTPVADGYYVFIRAQVTNPDGAQCVSPIVSSDIGSLFASTNLDLAISVQPIGFQWLDSTKEVPLASYSFTDKGSYCRSVWQHPIMVVPPSPFKAAVQGLPSEPSIVLQFRSSATQELSILEPVQGLIGVASALATGGAANTVVGIAKVVEGPAVKFLSDEFKKRRKTQADGTVEIPLLWKDIAAGVTEKKFKILTGTREQWGMEPVDKAIARIKSNPKGEKVKEVLDITFKIQTQRSMFVSDDALNEKYLPANAINVSTYAILNYPGIEGVPNLYQRINSSAPSLAQKLSAKKPADCDALLVTIRDLGFNQIDRALIIGAVLDEAVPKWREDPTYYNACFRYEPTIPARLVSVYGDSYFPAPPKPPVVFPELELSLNPPTSWTDPIKGFLSKARKSFFSKGDTRLNGLGLGEAGKRRLADSPTYITDLALPQAPAQNTTIADVLRDSTISQAGCFFGWETSATEAKRAAMIVVARNADGSDIPYVIDFAFAPNDTDATVTFVEMYPIQSPVANNYAALFSATSFRSESICARGAMKSGAEVLESLVRRPKR
jgi:hypothetical protein